VLFVCRQPACITGKWPAMLKEIIPGLARALSWVTPRPPPMIIFCGRRLRRPGACDRGCTGAGRSRLLGRPGKSIQIRDLIRLMSMANPLWVRRASTANCSNSASRRDSYRRQIRECLDHILKFGYFSTAAVAAISSSMSGQANALTPTDAPGGSSAPASANSSVRHLPEAPM
jgi:hypothetical protein